MPINKSVIAAVAAAVNTYIQDDEAARISISQQVVVPPPVPLYSPWVMAGRAASMEMRRTWQLRLAR